MKLNIICLVGVIGSGKDYYVEHYKAEEGEIVHEIKVGSLMTKIAADVYKTDLSTKQLYEKWKNTEDNREKLITLVESIKKYLGEDIFANQAAEEINEVAWQNMYAKTITCIISDACFPSNIKAIYKGVIAQFPTNVSTIPILPIRLANFKIHFCNYKSPRYVIISSQPREKFPIFLINQGFQDGQEWNYEAFKTIIEFYDLKRTLDKDEKS